MKVLFLNQIPEVNNKYTFSLARALKKGGVDIVVCGISTDNYEAYSDCEIINIFNSYSSLSNPISKIISYKNSWESVLKYCVNQRVDIVHVQWYIFSPFDFYYHEKLRKNGVKVVTTIHDLLPFNSKFYDKFFHKKIYSKADKVITQAKMNITELINNFGTKKEHIEYIPHGHYMEFAENATKEESLNALGLPDDRKIILFFGQIKKVKGVDVLLEAMADVAVKHPEALCLIAGKVWKDDFSIYQEIIDRKKLAANVRLDIKFIDDEDIKFYFNAADIVVLPYRQIYQSGVVLLAYAYEKPVIATTEGEFLNVIKNKETGLLVPSGDYNALSKGINWYLDNPNEAKKYAKDGKKDIDLRLNWDTIGRQTIGVYNEILDGDNE
ncbi:hypothetical protein BXO88_01300 [Oribacterium sp. C9]|uniref:glycosyltransferase family 4 protein n=1 Tax=Oribacterium sp. C9 TaxID=1943579 RepID=UPI00098FCA10|nr:glycosyltransferase family 4 protein [Oribacterium sp. C9]OON88456.1 hypothetical protein BXO88_01300 [Oribacterium sp. C9]